MKKFFKMLLDKGIFFSYGSKPSFDPYYQERTDAMDDITKKQIERGKNVSISNSL